MTRDDIIRMAREAGFSLNDGIISGGVSDLERFAALVAAAEREWLIELLNTKYRHTPPQIVEAIRARGQA